MSKQAIRIVLLAAMIVEGYSRSYFNPRRRQCDPFMVCPDTYHPVCGSDGVTYNNTCMLVSQTCDQHVTVEHSGECVQITTAVTCHQEKHCILLNDPVCGSDGITYPNFCVLKSKTCGSDVTLAYQGKCIQTTTAPSCNPMKYCGFIYEPVCGTDSLTYDSLCHLETQTCGSGVTVAHLGVCPNTTTTPCRRGRPCILLYDPVCGSDNITYQNFCVMKSKTCGSGVTLAYQGKCIQTTTTAPCYPIKYCPLIYDPVCGSDGISYHNKCLLKSKTCGKVVTIAHPGDCIKATPTVPCNPDMLCADIHDPVCGSDALTYPSLCHLETQTCGSDVTIAHQGECFTTNIDLSCDPYSSCPIDDEPVCGSDGANYPNPCVMEVQNCGKDVSVKQRGEC